MKKSSAIYTIYFLVNDSNTGDNFTAYAIAHGLKYNLGNTYEVTEINKDNLKFTKDIIEENDIVVGAGLHNLFVLTDLNAFTIWSCHQLPDVDIDFINMINLVAIPEHSFYRSNSDIITTNLLKTFGVAHSRRIEDIIQAYSDSTIKRSSCYEFLILSGDAPEENGTIKYFSAEAAILITNYVNNNRLENSHLLVTNSHRTGKHNPSTGNVIEYGSEIDNISQECLATLQGSEYDFFNARSITNNYPALLGSVYTHTEKSRIYIPGESISMISEALSLFHMENIFIYETDSMSGSHYAHLKIIRDRYRVNYLELRDEFTLTPMRETASKSSKYNACDDIVENAFNILKERQDKLSTGFSI